LSNLLGNTHSHKILDREDGIPENRGIFFIGCRHDQYATAKFPDGSIVIDPFRYVSQPEGVQVISIGKTYEKN